MNYHVNFESENQEFLLEKIQFFKCGNFAAPPCNGLPRVIKNPSRYKTLLIDRVQKSENTKEKLV